MNRNVIIIIIILILALGAGYLVWLRAKLMPQFPAQLQRVEDIEQSTLPLASVQPSPVQTSTPSAKASPLKSATPSATPKK